MSRCPCIRHIRHAAPGPAHVAVGREEEVRGLEVAVQERPAPHEPRPRGPERGVERARHGRQARAEPNPRNTHQVRGQGARVPPRCLEMSSSKSTPK